MGGPCSGGQYLCRSHPWAPRTPCHVPARRLTLGGPRPRAIALAESPATWLHVPLTHRISAVRLLGPLPGAESRRVPCKDSQGIRWGCLDLRSWRGLQKAGPWHDPGCPPPTQNPSLRIGVPTATQTLPVRYLASTWRRGQSICSLLTSDRKRPWGHGGRSRPRRRSTSCPE